ncbi:phosphoribosylanthranilate isomerase [Candidatus Margulisiibacteriota bacterium]
MAKVKICGITDLDDALFAVKSGTDFLGFVFAKSPRRISPLMARKIIQKLPKKIKKVGVFVDENPRKVNAIVKFCKLDLVQLHGDEPPEQLRKIRAKTIKAIRIKGKKDIDGAKKYKKAFAVLLDTYVKGLKGGTGKTFDWNIAKEIQKLGLKVFLSGGISPKNAKKAVLTVKPFAVDSSSGVERLPGKKDLKKVRALIKAVKG